jgi:hypothetical protein
MQSTPASKSGSGEASELENVIETAMPRVTTAHS